MEQMCYPALEIFRNLKLGKLGEKRADERYIDYDYTILPYNQNILPLLKIKDQFLMNSEV